MTADTEAVPLNTREVARIFRVSATTVGRWADEGKLACWRTPGGQRRYRPQDVEAFAAFMAGEPREGAA